MDFSNSLTANPSIANTLKKYGLKLMSCHQYEQK